MTSAAAFALLRYLEPIPMFLPPAAVPMAARPVPASSPAAVERDRPGPRSRLRVRAHSLSSARETVTRDAAASSGTRGEIDVDEWRRELRAATRDVRDATAHLKQEEP